MQPRADRAMPVGPGTIVRAGRQWVVIGDRRSPTKAVHYDTAGQLLGTHDLREGTTIFGRQSPDVTLASDDASLSRRHLAVMRHGDTYAVKDLCALEPGPYRLACMARVNGPVAIEILKQ